MINLLEETLKFLETNHVSPDDVLYVSGEESLRQIKLRAQRIGEMNEVEINSPINNIKSLINNIYI